MAASVYPDPALPLGEQSEEVIARLALVYEARGEREAMSDLDAVPMAAVAWVFVNRSVRRKTSLKVEMLRPAQISSFNPTDPNFGLFREILNPKHREQPWLRICYERADAVMDLIENGFTRDPTGGALNYYNPAVVEPSWGQRNPAWRTTAHYGHHLFGVAP